MTSGRKKTATGRRKRRFSNNIFRSRVAGPDVKNAIGRGLVKGGKKREKQKKNIPGGGRFDFVPN